MCHSLIEALSDSFMCLSACLSVSKMYWLQLALPCRAYLYVEQREHDGIKRSAAFAGAGELA